MKTGVIVNPEAGRKLTIKKWPSIDSELKRNKIDFKVVFTEKEGEAGSLAANLQKEGCSRFLIAGGDGTLHEVINGLDLNSEIIIGILPTGTGNDFSRAVKIPLDIKQAVEVISRGKSKLIDLGLVNNRRFINIAGVGFDAEIARVVNTGLSFLSGNPAYMLATLKTLVSYKCRPVDIYINGDKLTKNILLFSVANAPYIGGGIKIVPGAEIDDGIFHICMAHDAGKLDILLTLPKIYSGRHEQHPKVDILKADKVMLKSKYPLALHADGELIGTLPAKFEILPKALRVFVPGVDG